MKIINAFEGDEAIALVKKLCEQKDKKEVK